LIIKKAKRLDVVPGRVGVAHLDFPPAARHDRTGVTVLGTVNCDFALRDDAAGLAVRHGLDRDRERPDTVFSTGRCGRWCGRG